VGDDVQRFSSNKTLFLKTLMESIADLHSYAVIEQDTMPERNSREEQEARHLRWPETNRPYWKAVCAVLEQFSDTTRATMPTFEDRELGEEVYAKAINRDDAEARLGRALGRVEAIIGHSVVESMESEPLPDIQWGRLATRALRDFYHRVLLAGQDDARILKGFGVRVHDSLLNLWNPVGTAYGLGTIFPQTRHPKATPSQIRRIQWPTVPAAIPEAGLAKPEQASRVIASYLLLGATGWGD
jgi:hypothetical protein